MIGNYIEAGRQRMLERGIQKIRGTETGNVVRINREFIDSILIEMRMIDAVDQPDTSYSLFGKNFKTPVMSAALSGLDNIKPHGMATLAKGMAAAGACMWAGIGTAAELHDIVSAGAPTIKIIKPYRDEDKIFEKLEQAEKEGCLAVGMDTSFFFGSQVGEQVIARDLVCPKSAAQLRRYIEATKLPFIFKGVLSETDAKKALDLGVGGMVVSSHSGSVMDYALPPMMLLPRIAALTAGRVHLFIDGDIKRGSDVYKALALGASGALVGRGLMAGLEMDGAEGVTKVVEGITEELRRIMGQTGCAALADISPDRLWLRGNSLADDRKLW